mmetsp:Transcript_25218/g.32112  ORF Transcript_25218/g.32112 Transcript_25218/m.32112 type:complete len:84 (+) Transcript_25218:210-461(+)
MVHCRPCKLVYVSGGVRAFVAVCFGGRCAFAGWIREKADISHQWPFGLLGDAASTGGGMAFHHHSSRGGREGCVWKSTADTAV